MDVFRRQCSRSHSMNTYSTSEEFRTRWKVSANIATSRFTITMHEMNKSDDHEARRHHVHSCSEDWCWLSWVQMAVTHTRMQLAHSPHCMRRVRSSRR